LTIIGGPLIKIARHRAGFTQRELAERLALPQSSIARWESGARQPTIDNLVEAVRACGLDVTVALHAMDRSNDGFIWELLDETPAERLRRMVAAANELQPFRSAARRSGSSTREPRFDPLAVIEALTTRELDAVLIGGIAENMRGSPVVPLPEVVICPSTDPASRRALDATLRDVDASPWRETATEPRELRTFHHAERWVVPAAGGTLVVVDTPHGTDGYPDLTREATVETVGEGLEAEVASLLDLVRIADASVHPPDRSGLPTLKRAYELGLDYLPPGERPVEIPEGLEELLAGHGVKGS
jgi:transcriptional regulator with XRE-family HTH domain